MSQTFIKIMSGQDMPDNHQQKEYELITLNGKSHVSFHNDPHPHICFDGGQLEVKGNVYVMNTDGKTIATFNPKTNRNEDRSWIKEAFTDKTETNGQVLLELTDRLIKFNDDTYLTKSDGKSFKIDLDTVKLYDDKLSYLISAFKGLPSINVQVNEIIEPQSKLQPSTLIGRPNASFGEVEYTKEIDYQILFLLDSEFVKISPILEARQTDYLIEVLKRPTFSTSGSTAVPKIFHYECRHGADIAIIRDNKKDLYLINDKATFLLHPNTNLGF